MEREYTVTADTDALSTFREEWLGTAAFTVDRGVGTPTLTMNVQHGDRVVRESIDLGPMLTQWAKDITKELKKK